MHFSFSLLIFFQRTKNRGRKAFKNRKLYLWLKDSPLFGFPMLVCIECHDNVTGWKKNHIFVSYLFLSACFLYAYIFITLRKKYCLRKHFRCSSAAFFILHDIVPNGPFIFSFPDNLELFTICVHFCCEHQGKLGYLLRSFIVSFPPTLLKHSTVKVFSK